MKKIIQLTIQLFLFWLVLFALQHSIFLIYNHSELKEIGWGQILSSYYHAIGMDISASGYLMSIPALLLICALFIKKNNIFINAIHITNITLIIACLIISVSDTALYSIWGTKINGKALSYWAFPKDAIMSFAAVPYWLFIVILAAQCVLCIYLYKRMFRPGYIAPINAWKKITFSIILLFLIFTAIRGGYQRYPINKGWAYYSKYAVLNYSALNGFWNFMEVVLKPESKVNPYKYFQQSQAEAIVKAMHTCPSDSTQMILTTNRPNIVLILMESVSAECMASLHGACGIMPELDSLTKDGLLFPNFYANGFRTEQGLIAFLSSFPAQPKTTIMRKFGKFEKLPNLAKTLGENGYSENYYASGNLDFANTAAYLRSSGFNKLIGKDDYPWKSSTGWGAYDEELFACHLNEAEKDAQPFFSIIMTTTNHEPFDGKVEKIFTGSTCADCYKNTAHYTGKCIYDYLQKAKSKSWYNNTLFIITSDHAHSYPLKRGANEAERHHIPMLFYGNVIKPEYKGKQNIKTASQIDLPAILLAQLQIPYQQFTKSKNIFNKNANEFAFYTFDNGFGMVTPTQTIVYDHNIGQVVYRKVSADSAMDEKITNQGKAYLQTMFEEYLNLNN